MADNLIFPIGFDLEKGVKDAQAQMDSALHRLQKTADSKPLTIPMSLDASKFTTFEAAFRGSIQHITDDAKNLKAALDNSLKTDNSANINRITEAMRNLEAAWKALPNNQKFDINDRLTPKAQEMVRQFNELATASSTYGQTLSQIAGKIKRAADEEAKANQKRNDGYTKLRKTLGAQENSIANLSAKIKAYQQILNSKEIGSRSFERVAEKIRKLTEKLEAAKTKVRELTQTATSGNARHAKSVQSVNNEYQNTGSYLTNLLKKTAALWSVHQVQSFLMNVKDVTAQFELQRISLGAILQDQNKANQLFSEIKSFALKSPVSILDLTKYTKQLAAYKVGWDGVKTDTKELFEWTKKLTDVSVGLGVSMDRVVLAFGQVRATGYLRGCLGRGTSVKMFDGSNKKVEDVLVGDAIMGDDGQKRNVLSLVRNRETMYVVKFDGGSFRCNENHILTLYNINSGIVEDVYVLDYLKYPALYKGVKYTNGGYEYFDMSVERDCEDDYFGFEIDGNKRFIIEGNIVTHNSEVRQFTEMGVPIVEELAEKLKKLNGEAVTTEQVMDMISKRAISFDMVKEVFDDMTSAGGIFYNMQEKQGNTLYGMWAKLGDAASVMYEQIGNTGAVNSSMKGMIQLLTDLMRNWEATGATVMAAVAGITTAMSVSKLRKKGGIAGMADAYNTKMQAREDAAILKTADAEDRLTAAKNKGTAAEVKRAQAALKTAQADEKAAIAANTRAKSMGIFRAAWSGMLASIGSTLAWGTAIAAIAALIGWITKLITDATRLKNALDDIKNETGIEQSRSVTNFESLANAAVNAANGSKQQRDALEELKRTYRDIIPEQDLTIEKLREMRGNYESLTSAIEENIRQQQLQKGQSEIENEYGKKLLDAEEFVRHQLTSSIYVAGANIGEQQANRIIDNIKRMVKEGMDGTEALKKAYDLEGITLATETNWDRLANSLGIIKGEGEGLAGVLQELATKTEEWKNRMQPAYSELGLLADYMVAADKKVAEHNFAAAPDSFEFDQEKAKTTIDAYIEAFKNALKAANVNIDLNKYITIGTDGLPQIDWSGIDKILLALDNKLKVPLQNMSAEIQSRYYDFIPKDPVAISIRGKFIEIATSMKDGRNAMRQYLWDGKTDLKEHIKFLGDAVTSIRDKVYKYSQYIKNFGLAGKTLLLAMGIDVDTMTALAAAIEKLMEYEKTYVVPDSNKSKSNKTSKSDPRLQILNEMVQLAEKLNKEYSDWEKKVGSTKALEKVNETYAETVKYAEKVAKDAGISLPHLKTPTNAKELNEYLEAVRKVMESAKGLKDGKKAAIELAVKMSNNVSAEDQKAIEEKIKTLTDRISRTKTAKEFYEKILGMTGDVELAANVSLQIYGSTGKELSEQIKEQFRLAFATLDKPDAKVSAKIGDLIDKARYEELRDYIALLPEAQRKAAEDLVKAQQQMSVKQYEQWLKDLEKAKDYADKRIELSRYTANQIAAIEERIAKLDPAASDYEQQKAMLEKLIAGYKSREDKIGSELEYEQFKNSALYVQVFENLDNASKTALENMRNRLLALKDQWKNLSPEKVKELTKRLEELDAQIAQRNPFKSIADSIKKLREMRMDGRTKEGDAQIAFDAEADRQAAEAKMLADEKAYEAAVKQYGAESDIAKEKRKIADDSTEAYRNAEKMADSAAENADEWENVAEAINAANQKLDKYQEQINEALGGIRKIMESFGASAEDMQFFDDVTNGFNEIFDAGQQGAEAYASFMMGDFVGAATKGISAVGSLISGVTNLFYAGRVKRANKEIKKQQKLLEQLEYTMSRLEKQSNELFGTEYIQNYQQRLRNLYAQAEAQRKQAEAEKSKGKKTDKDKLKEFEDSYRDTMNEIADMQGELHEKLVGSDIASTARDWANAWIEAKTSFANTTDAMKEKFKDMMQNMVVETMIAKVMETALQPFYEALDKAAEDREITAEEMAELARIGFESMESGNKSAEILWEKMKQAGFDTAKIWKEANGEATGIAKSVGSASSEEINANTAALNTQNFYMSHIDENVAQIVVMMRSGTTTPLSDSSTATGWTDWQQQAMSSYLAIQQNTANTVLECKRAADACEKLMRTVKTKGAVSGFNVFLQ